MDHESQLIQIISQTVPQAAKFIGDDCATLQLKEGFFVFSLDNFTEGTHYNSRVFSPYDIGWKALAVNLSDIAAMAADPLYYLVGLSLPEKDSNSQWIQEFYSGMNDCANNFGSAVLIGGDISKSSQTSISVSVVGSTIYPGLTARSNAQVGDYICVTGKFGNSAKFLDDYTKHLENSQALQNFLQIESSDKQYHLQPTPRLKEAKDLMEISPRVALMDTSDGLAQALWAIAEASLVAIEFNPELIPRDSYISLDMALYGGEDYELVASCSEIPAGFVQIGKVVSQGNSSVKEFNTVKLLDRTKIYRHF